VTNRGEAIRRLLVAGGWWLVVAAGLAAQEPCTIPAGALGASRDLYCIELLTTGVADSARGTAQLDWPGGPFTVAVTAEGVHRWRVSLRLEGLPALQGPRAGYVAWAMPPSLAPVVRLGVAHAGLTRLGELAFDRFTVAVSAEPDTMATARAGPIVLIGESAGNRMRPADLYQFYLGSLVPRSEHAGHAGMADSMGWTGVPMYPGVDMLPSEMALRPLQRAWLPGAANAPNARPRQVLDLKGGDTLELTAGVVRRTIAGRAYTMFGFNGQYPGPLLRVRQAGRLVVRFHNRLPQPSSVHWHGLRLANASDGVPDVTQPAVPAGGDFTYTLRFPDAGIYWYHPHVREDIQQDLGLYGNIFVRDPAAAPPPVDREEFLILDDFLAGEDGAVPYGADQPTHAAMGRFGNIFLVNGEAGWRTRARQGDVIRYYLTNAANTRTFNISFGPDVRMKVVGSDLGNFTRQEWVQSVVIAPAERYVVDVVFDRAGSTPMVNRVHAIDHLYGRFFPRTDTLGLVQVTPPAVSRQPSATFDSLRTDDALAAVVARADQAPLRTLELRAVFTGLPFVSEQLMRIDSVFFNPVEWDGTMPGMNWSVTGAQAHWILRDPATGAENMDIHWRFAVGDLVRLRLVGVRDVLHGMQHPVHLHGQRFVVLAVDGIPNQNPVWKDTALLPAGGSLDLLVEFSNPGQWMLHCHIAEHLQAGMMTVFNVEAR